MELRAKGLLLRAKRSLEECNASRTVLTAAIAATWGLLILFIVLSYVGEEAKIVAFSITLQFVLHCLPNERGDLFV